MSEVPQPRPELDDIVVGGWYLGFAVYTPGIDSSVKNQAYYASVISSLRPTIRAFSFRDEEVSISMKLEGLTQKQAINVGFANLVEVFEVAEQPATVRTARMSPDYAVEMAILDGRDIELQDISLETIDLERELYQLHDIDDSTQLGWL